MSAFPLVQYTFTEWTVKLLTDGVPGLFLWHAADAPCSHQHPNQLKQGPKVATFTWVGVAESLLSVQPDADILSTGWSWVGASPCALVMPSSTGCWALRPRSPARPWAFYWRIWKARRKRHMQVITPLTVTQSPSISPRSTLPRLASTFLYPRTFGPHNKSFVSREGWNVLHSVDAKWSPCTEGLYHKAP